MRYFFWLALFLSTLVFADLHCPVCGMKTEEKSKIGFVVEGKKPFHFCSYVCASRYHKKNPTVKMYVFDFNTQEKIEADKSFFLIRSKNLLNEINAGMPPTVISFSKEEDAKLKQKNLTDGKIVSGLSALEKEFH